MRGEIVAPRRSRHAERLEDPLAREVGEGLAGDARDDDRGEVVAGVAVGPVACRAGKFSAFCRPRMSSTWAWVWTRVPRGQPAIHSTLPQSRRPLVWCSIWRIVIGDRRSRAVPGTYLRTGSSSESLPSRASSSTAAAVNCLETEPASKIVSGVFGDAVLEVRHAVGLLEHDAAVLRHADGATGRLCVPRRELRIDGGFRHGRSCLRDSRNRRHQQPDEQRPRKIHPAFPASACSFSVVARLRVVAWRPALPSSAAPALLFRIPSAKCR